MNQLGQSKAFAKVGPGSPQQVGRGGGRGRKWRGDELGGARPGPAGVGGEELVMEWRRPQRSQSPPTDPP